MSFNIETVMGDMLTAMKNSIDKDWDDIEDYAKLILENEKKALNNLAQQRLRNEITDEDLKSELDDEKDTIEAEMKALKVITKAMAQRATNAAMEILFNAIKIAL